MYGAIAAAYVRGVLPEVTTTDTGEAIASGQARGLDLHRFKRTSVLPRVRSVLGILRTLAPESLLDIGSGRGAFLWPLLDAFPGLKVTATDLLDHRVEMLEAIRRGGIDHLRVAKADVTDLPHAVHSFDVVTVLEVLEHLDHPEAAARQAVRVARRAVIASVPSKPDNNPEHIQLYDRVTLAALFERAGARRVKIDYVLNHMICVALLAEP
jgi:2-polyprenyl-3-methyl-5-hydroxy-6-metoxy-1,4-benzoquinol methylase